ncbi:MAG: tripartite tricarboxylate transporter substrate-binding protein [Pseudomonadota bacterium]
MRRLALTLTLLCNVASALAAVAPPYPARPVRMLLPQPPGGTMETVGRAVSQLVSQAWGQSIVIDNRSGANGIIAGELTVRALPDGYTLLYTSASLANNQLVHLKPSFDALKDLAPVTQVTTLPGYLVLVNAQLPARNMAELIELSKTARVHFGSSGHGNSQHLLGELVNARSGAKLSHVPYKGFAIIITALISNEVQVAFGAPTTVVQHIKAGRIRAIAYTGAQRWSVMPEVPTMTESGIPGLVYAASWHGLFAPVRTPAALIATVHAAFAKAVHSPQMAHMLTAGGHVAVGSTPAEFKTFLTQYFRDTAEQMHIAKVMPE